MITYLCSSIICTGRPHFLTYSLNQFTLLNDFQKIEYIEKKCTRVPMASHVIELISLSYEIRVGSD